MIVWTDQNCHVTPHFTVKDCLWLPRWSRLATEDDGLTELVKSRLVNLCNKMELVRVFLGNRPINPHVTFRPTAYNVLVKGAKNSAHLYGDAMDFDVKGLTCDEVRKLIVPKLALWNMRCERLKVGSPWVHCDCRSPGAGGRYFFP